jgi:hypothetical protein
METYKRCSRCGEYLPLSGFYRNRSRKDGLDPYCKCCRKAHNMNYSEAGAARQAERMRTDPDYREKWREYQRLYRLRRKSGL